MSCEDVQQFQLPYDEATVEDYTNQTADKYVSVISLKLILEDLGIIGETTMNLSYTASPTNGIIVNSGGDNATIPLADGTNAGLLAPAQHTKIEGIEANATADQTALEIATLYHTLAEEFTAAFKSKLEGIEVGAQVNSVLTVAGRTGTVVLTKADVGLANADNTSDADKPISTATQTALDTKLESTDITNFETTTQLNTRDTANRSRANHTGTQAISTIDSLQTTLDAKIDSDITGLTGATVVDNNVIITQAGYDAIGTPDANTVYNIVG